MPRSHEQMKQIVARGFGVTTESGRIITTADDLPSPAKLALASGDAGDREKARADAKARAEQARADLEALEAAERDQAKGDDKSAPAKHAAPHADEADAKDDDKAKPRAPEKKDK